MFIPNGYYFTTPQRQDSTWGSYIPGDGDGATGEITLRFNNPLGGQKIAIPVAGYPTHEGIHFEVEQNGERTPVSIGEDPKESWGTGYADIKPGDFAIKLKDSRKSTWIAVAMPSVIGRFDNLVQRILSGYYLFALLGIAIVVVLILYKGLSNSNTSTTVG